ncbi:MAG: 50S ribosomal protein L2, partial [Proteobacteria bacterium]
MPIRKFRPLTPGRRFMSIPTYSEITKSKPEKSLLEPIKKHGGRNNSGKLTIRNRGGGNKRMYRLIDFKRQKDGVVGIVAAIEY